MSRRLDRSIEHRLTLVLTPRDDAEALSILADWADSTRSSVLWLELTPGHNDPTVFLADVRSLLCDLPAMPPAMSASPTPGASVEEALVDLLNMLLAPSADFFLVLQGYDVIHSKAVHRIVGRMLDYLPPRMHIVIVAHQEPALSNLPRLRVRRQVLTLSIS